MEDSKETPPQSKGNSSPADRVIELTPELEVISATRGKIIDLTQALFSPGTAPAAKPAPATPKPIVARTSSPFSAKVSRPKGLESDVDATFDYIQRKAEALRGPRVEPTPSKEDLKVSAPLPIGDWDDTLVGEALMPEEAEAAPEEAPAPEPTRNIKETPAETVSSPSTDDVPEAFSAVEAETSSMEDLKADDTLELTDIVLPIDLTPPDEMPAPPLPAEAIDSTPESPEIMEILEEEPASLLEAAIEIEEEIIELTDIVPAEELAADEFISSGTASPQAESAQEEEEIIELTDIVSAEELAAADFTAPETVSTEADAEEEEIIELTDIASAEELAAADVAPAGATAPRADQVQEEEEIIELIDRVELPLPEETAAMASELTQNPPEPLPEFELEAPAPDDLADKDTEKMTMEVFAEAQAPPEPAPEAIKPETDQVIRLDTVLSHVRKSKERISEEITMDVEEALAKETVSPDEKFSIGIAMEDVKEALGPGASPNETEIEAVIEKVIRTKYGQTIEQMIATVVEKVVTREMDNIKRNLMEDQGGADES